MNNFVLSLESQIHKQHMQHKSLAIYSLSLSLSVAPQYQHDVGRIDVALVVATTQASSIQTHGVAYVKRLVDKLNDSFWVADDAIDKPSDGWVAFSDPTMLENASALFRLAKVSGFEQLHDVGIFFFLVADM